MSLLVRLAVGAISFQLTGELITRAPRVLLSRSRRPVALIALGAAVGGGLADGAPTALPAVDFILRAAFAAGVAAASARARRWTWLVASCATLVLSDGADLDALAFAATGAALAMAAVHRRSWAVGAFIGGCLSQVLLRLELSETTGASAATAAAIAGLLLWSGLRHTRRATRRRLWVAVGSVTAAGVVVSAAALLAALSAANDVREGVDAAKQGISDARGGATDDAAARFAIAADSFDDANDVLGAWWATPALAVPVVGHQLDAVRTLSRSGSELSNSASVAATEVDVDGLRLRAGTIDLHAVERVADTLRPVVTTLREVSADVSEVASPWLLWPIAEAVDELDERVTDAYEDAHTASLVLDVAQPMLGAERERRWFLAMMTPSELRASGGLIGTIGEISARDGTLSLKNTREVRQLNEAVDDSAAAAAIPPVFNEEYAGWEVAENIQNASVAPDFATTAQALEAVQPLAAQGEFDGVIGVDPLALSALLDVLGPVSIDSWPVPIDASNAARVLLHEQYVSLPNDVRERFLGDVLNAVWAKVTEGELPSPTVLARALGPMVQGRHIQLHSRTAAEQQALTKLGADGSLPRGSVDRLTVTTQNASESKADWFLRRSIDYDTTYDPGSGATEATLTLTLANDAPAEGLPPIVLGSRWAPPGHNRQIVEVHTPLELGGAKVNGSTVGTLPSTGRVGARVHRMDVTVSPGSEIHIEFKLFGMLAASPYWTLSLGHQPTIKPDHLSLAVTPAADWRIAAVGPLFGSEGSVGTARTSLDRPTTVGVSLERTG